MRQQIAESDQGRKPIQPQPPVSAPVPEDESVAGEEDPGAALDLPAQTPVPKPPGPHKD